MDRRRQRGLILDSSPRAHCRATSALILGMTLVALLCVLLCNCYACCYALVMHENGGYTVHACIKLQVSSRHGRNAKITRRAFGESKMVQTPVTKPCAPCRVR